MVEVSPQSVGQRLKDRRLEREMSLGDVAVSTRMSKAALEAIERDDLKRLPGGIFARAFIRNYARELGLDAEQTLKDFLAQFPAAEVDPQEEAAFTATRRPSASPATRAVVHFGLASLPLAMAILWFAFSPDNRLAAPLAADRISAARADVPPPDALRPVADVRAIRETEAVPASHQAGMLNLVLTMRSACWVSAAADGRPIVERLLSPGEVVELNAERVVAVKVGDAGAVAMQINGEAARSLGGPGQVVSARIDQSNFRDFLTVP